MTWACSPRRPWNDGRMNRSTWVTCPTDGQTFLGKFDVSMAGGTGRQQINRVDYAGGHTALACGGNEGSESLRAWKAQLEAQAKRAFETEAGS